MLVKEVQKIVNNLVEKGCGEYSLVVNTADDAIGSSASVQVQCIYPGFDWEQGQIRLQTNENIVRAKQPPAQKRRISIPQPTDCTECIREHESRDSYPCNNCNRNTELLLDHYNEKEE